MQGLDTTTLDIISDEQLLAKQKTPLFLYHGTEDPTINIKNSELTYEYLRSEIYTGKYRSNLEYNSEEGLEHTLSGDEFD